jgi:hypothetical protein
MVIIVFILAATMWSSRRAGSLHLKVDEGRYSRLLEFRQIFAGAFKRDGSAAKALTSWVRTQIPDGP